MENRGPVPTIGDNRYNRMYHKPALDILRVEYYNLFRKDLSISEKTDDHEMFDPNISEYANKYMLRGLIPSTIMLPSNKNMPQSNTFLNWKLSASSLDDLNFSQYLEYMKKFLIKTTGSNFNFVYNYANFNNYYLAYIPTGSNKSNLFELRDFIKDLMDNSIINIVSLSGELLADSKNRTEIEDRINEEHEYIKKELGICCKEHNTDLLVKKLTLY